MPRNVLMVLFILGPPLGCLLALLSFLTAIICAATLAIATWPMVQGLERQLGGRRGLAIVRMMAGIGLAFLIPLFLGSVAVVQSIGKLSAWVQDESTRALPPLPHWMTGLPILGARLQAAIRRQQAPWAQTQFLPG